MRSGPTTSHLCYIGECVPFFWHSSVRKSVCRDLPARYNVGGRHYCILHAPTRDKNWGDFMQVFRARLDAQDNDFRGVWFPELTGLNGYRFQTAADFSFAHFAGKLYFWLVKFERDVNFWAAVFESDVDFSETRFYGNADMRFARFLSNADFSLTQFKGRSDFFGSYFHSNVLFTGAWFGRQSVSSFEHMTFNAGVDFQFALIDGKITFKGTRGHRIFNEKAPLSLAYAEIKPKARLCFDTVLLNHDWFSETDEKKMVFKTVRWDGEKTSRPAKKEKKAARAAA